MPTSGIYTDVELIQEFSDWNYNAAWWGGPCKRMPYLEMSKDKHVGLLTTASYSDYFEYGTIVSNLSDNEPSKWINSKMPNPGVIWYWVNENDCDAKYTKGM